jgi:hypothetical protein
MRVFILLVIEDYLPLTPSYETLQISLIAFTVSSRSEDFEEKIAPFLASQIFQLVECHAKKIF